MLLISRPDVHAEIHGRLTWRDSRPTLVAAGLAVGAALLLLAGFASVSPTERPVALESLTNSIVWIAAALIGACSTIAALMLTTLSLMEQLETRRMGPSFVFHLRLTVLGAIGTIALAVGALLLTTFPFASGADVNPAVWQIDAVLYGLQGLTVLMVGGFAVVLSSLYATVSDIFRNLPRAWVDDLLADDEPEAESNDDAGGGNRVGRLGAEGRAVKESVGGGVR